MHNFFDFHSVGFRIEETDSYVQLLNHAAEHGEVIETPGAIYTLWKLDCGVELWLTQEPDGTVVDLFPFFNGNARVGMWVTGRATEDFKIPMMGGFCAEINPHIKDAPPTEDDPPFCDYPTGFHTPGYDLYRDLPIPSIQNARYVGFASELFAFQDEDAFQAWQVAQGQAPLVPSLGVIYKSSTSFYPSENPRVLKELAGIIKDTAEITNDFTGEKFIWIWAETYGGEIDVVTSPDFLDGTPVIGGVIHGDILVAAKFLS